MITDAREVSPLMAYAYRFEMTGLRPALIQKCKVPVSEFEVVELYGGAQTLPVPYAGKEKLSEFTLETVFDAEGDDRLFWQNRRDEARTRDPRRYKRDATILVLGADDNPNMNGQFQSAFFTKVDIEEFDSTEGGGKKMMTCKATGRCSDFNWEAL